MIFPDNLVTVIYVIFWNRIAESKILQRKVLIFCFDRFDMQDMQFFFY